MGTTTIERLRAFSARLGKHKTVEHVMADAQKQQLKRVLNTWETVCIGVGEIIGAGIFVLTGVAARTTSGPAVMLSYAFAGICCIFSALCYSEFATRVPISGSAYTYAYTVVGELIAWIIGWDLTLEYTVAAATVARGFSGYMVVFFQGFGIMLPKALTALDLGILVVDPTAAVLILLLTIILSIGVKDSSIFNTVLTVITMIVILMVLGGGAFFVDTHNWSPFLPYGTHGIFAGASLVFFAFVGFDSVTTLSEEMKNPKRDLPIGIIGSLLVSLVLYVSVSAVITLMVPYNLIEENSPIASAFADRGLKWMQIIISIGAFAALTTTLLNSMLGQARIYFSMARDGLLWEFMANIHPRFKTPFISQWITGIFAIALAFFFDLETLSEMVSIGTLLAFTIVCSCILFLRYKTTPENPQPYRLNVFYLVLVLSVLSLITSFSLALEWHIGVSVFFAFITLLCSALFFLLKKDPTDSPPPDTFMCPLVPVVPMLGIYSNVYMMANLAYTTWIRLLIWLLVGFVIYFSYSIKHSKVGNNSFSVDNSHDNNISLQDANDNEAYLSTHQIKLQEKKQTLLGSTTHSNHYSDEEDNNAVRMDEDNDSNIAGTTAHRHRSHDSGTESSNITMVELED